MNANDTVRRARAWLNGPGKDKVLILWQCVAAGYIVWLFVSQFISKGTFPPKPIDDEWILALAYGIFIWCILALVAGIAILLKKVWGWWLELAILVPAAIGVITYFWFDRTYPPSTVMNWVQLFAAVLFTFFALKSLRDLTNKVMFEAGKVTKNP